VKTHDLSVDRVISVAAFPTSIVLPRRASVESGSDVSGIVSVDHRGAG